MAKVKESAVNVRLSGEEFEKLQRLRDKLAARLKLTKVTQGDALRYCINVAFDQPIQLPNP
jgi:hypothetical protein